MSGDELVEHFLEDVLRLGGVQHAAANEIPETTTPSRPHGGRDLSILFRRSRKGHSASTSICRDRTYTLTHIF